MHTVKYFQKYSLRGVSENSLNFSIATGSLQF